MKVFFRNIHLYLSLAAGLVIMSCCFSGAILVFEKELQEAFNHDRYFVQQEQLQMPIEQLISNVKQQYSKAKIAGVKIYSDPKRSVEIGISMPGKEGKGEKRGEKEAKQAAPGETSKSQNPANKEGQGKPGMEGKGKEQAAGGGRPTHTAFVNPYTGKIIELYNYRETFYFKMFSLHRWLLGSESSVGKTITGIATFVFLFILITGIILWWPRNKAILKHRLRIKTDASFKRLNHDLHIVLGFYSAIFLFIFAFTALAWSFKWFNEGIYKVTNSPMKPVEPPHSTFALGEKPITYDSAFITISKTAGDVQYYSLRAPNDSVGAFNISVLPTGAHESALDNYYLDQYTGSVIGSQKFSERNLGQRVRSTFKPIHVGSIYGLPSKIIACLVCLLGVTFPVTGVIMWINRLKKKKNKTNKSTVKRRTTATAGDLDDDDEDEDE